MERDNRLIAFKRLLDIMDELREKCPWDSKQTFDSLRYLTIEETYELSEAIMENNMEEIRKELGDLMLHLVFYSKIGEEKKAFNIESVLNGICDKLINRHPHIYGNVDVKSSKDVEKNWEKIKMKEGRNSVLSGVPKSLPAMVKAHRIQEKVSGVGFDWDNENQVWNKVKEEIDELLHEVNNNGEKDKKEDEFGDVIFALINYARFIDVNPEDSLERTNKKFIKRFMSMEKQAKALNKPFSAMNLEEMEKLWNIAKTEE